MQRIAQKNNCSIWLSALILLCAVLPAYALPPLSLLAVYKAAVNHDPQLASAQAQYRSDREAVPQARAQLLPQLALKGSGERKLERITGLPGQNSALHQNYDQVQYGVQLSQPLVKASAWFGLARAHDRVTAAHWQLQAARQTLMARTAQLYFSLLKRQSQLATDQRAIRADRRRLQQVQREIQGGIASLLDVNQVKGELANDRVKVVKARGAVRSSRARLQALTGYAVDRLQPLASRTPWPTTPRQSLHQWLSRLSQTNPRVRAAAAQMRAADAHLTSAKAAHWPTLSLQARYQESLTGQPLAIGSSLPSVYRTGTTSVSLNLTMPLYSGGATWSRQRQAQAQMDQRQDKYRQAFQKAAQAVRLDYEALVTDRQTLLAATQAESAQHTAYQAAEMGYRDGTRNIVDVIQAQRAWFKARQSRIASRYQYVIDWVKLRQTSGVLSRASLVRINHWLKEET